MRLIDYELLIKNEQGVNILIIRMNITVKGGMAVEVQLHRE
jgi:hypothetical protein